MNIKDYELVISPGNPDGWHASVFKVDINKDQPLFLVGDSKCRNFKDACDEAWNIMQKDRGLRNEIIK